jgi:hypothetical protein
MCFGLHSLRSASNEMQSSCSASFHSGESSSATRPRRVSQPNFSGTFRSPSCEFGAKATFLWGQSVARASRPLVSQNRVGAPRRSAAPGSQLIGAAVYGSDFPSLRCYAPFIVVEVSFRASNHKAACLCARPNPSIERTSPGKPGAASHLKR